MAMASTKKGSGLPILNKTRSVIKSNNTIQISKLPNRDQIHGKFRDKRDTRNIKIRSDKIALMSYSAKVTISSLNTPIMRKRLAKIQMRGIGNHMKRSSRIQHPTRSTWL
jgi:hypothetical protein